MLSWKSNGQQYSYEIHEGTFIFDDDTILIMNNTRDRVIALSETGEHMAELDNSYIIYLMYLQKHPRFGLSVVVSIADQNGNWSDKYMSWVSGKFEIVSNSR